MEKIKEREKKDTREIIDKILSDFSEDYKDYRLIFVDNTEILKNYDSLAVAEELAKNDKTIVCIRDDKGLVFSASQDVDIDLRGIAREIGSILGGGGGAKEKLARCGGNKLENIEKAMKEAKMLIESQLSG